MSSGLIDTAEDGCILLLALFGLLSNLLVVILFYRKPSLRSPSNRFVGSLVFANLVSAMIFAPVLLWRFTVIVKGVEVFIAASSVFSILSIALDRYSAVLSPLHYSMTVTRRRSMAVIVGIWCLAGVLSLPNFLLQCDMKDVFLLVHSLVLLFLCFMMPLFSLILIYSRMYAAAHSNSVRTRRASQCGTSGGGSGFDSDGTRRSSNSVFSALLFREEGRAVKTGFMVIASYLFCWGPYFISNSIEASTGLKAPQILITICVLSSSTLNPFIYVFRNDLVRKEIKRLFCCWCEETQQKPSKPLMHASTTAPTLRHQSSSQCDSGSIQSFQVSTMPPLPLTPIDCCRHTDTPPPADFVATYKQVSGDATKYESVTFRLAQRRCHSCIRQNSDSSTGSNHPLLTSPRKMPSSEPSTPRHITNNNMDEKTIVFILGEGSLEEEEPKKGKLERKPAIDDNSNGDV